VADALAIAISCNLLFGYGERILSPDWLDRY